MQPLGYVTNVSRTGVAPSAATDDDDDNDDWVAVVYLADDFCGATACVVYCVCVCVVFPGMCVGFS